MKHLNVDVHGMELNIFVTYIANLMDYTPIEVEDICIIHGYNHGTAIREYVRQKFMNNRLIEIQVFEEGRTILRLIH